MLKVSAEEEVDDIEVGKSGVSLVVAAIRNNGMKEGSDCSGVGGGCGDNARVVDSVSTDSSTDAASDFIVDFIVRLFGFRVVIRYIFGTVSRAITTEDGCDGGGVDKARYFGFVHTTPFRRVGIAIGAAIIQRGAIRVKI